MKLNTTDVPDDVNEPIIAYFESTNSFNQRLGGSSIQVQIIMYPDDTVEMTKSLLGMKEMYNFKPYNDFEYTNYDYLQSYITPERFVLVHWEYL